uniref:Uncharacterized protein n=1 Tax=Solanum tuberosum TaxID=4113 RepID=M0ZXT1_SOLTU
MTSGITLEIHQSSVMHNLPWVLLGQPQLWNLPVRGCHSSDHQLILGKETKSDSIQRKIITKLTRNCSLQKT